MINHVDLLVVGAGPAGLSAAVAARSCGLDVTVVDEQAHMGGQIFRNLHLPSGTDVLDAHDRVLGEKLFEDFAKSGANFFAQTTVWGHKGNEVFCQYKGKAQRISASKILFAVGGMERPVPFKGWTLPGVMTAGAAEVLLRSGMPLCGPKEPVVLAGNGPLLLSLAEHLIDAKIPIAAWLDTGNMKHKLRSIIHMGMVYKDMPYFVRGMKMALKILKSATPIVPMVTHMEALGSGALERVCYEKKGVWHEIVASRLIRHENVIPRIQIAGGLELDMAWDKVQRYWYPCTDSVGRTSQNHVYMAGDGAFVYGGEAAMAQGAFTGVGVAQDLGVIPTCEAKKRALPYGQKVRTLRQARGYLRHVFAPNAQIFSVPDETIICRCESVSASCIRQAVAEGYTTPDEVKRFTRCGMGPCQGRMCGSALAEILAQELGRNIESLPLLRTRQPFAPVSLEEYCLLHASE